MSNNIVIKENGEIRQLGGNTFTWTMNNVYVSIKPFSDTLIFHIPYTERQYHEIIDQIDEKLSTLRSYKPMKTNNLFDAEMRMDFKLLPFQTRVTTRERYVNLYKLAFAIDRIDFGTMSVICKCTRYEVGAPQGVPLNYDNRQLLFGNDNNINNLDRQIARAPVRAPDPEDVDEPDASLQCSICYEKRKIILFQPCNHVACCYSCSTQIHTCVICRGRISQKVRIYL